MTAEPVSVHAPPLHRPRLLRQHWRDVAFLHWAVDPAAVAGLLPPDVRTDMLDGRTYVGLVPFRMVGTGLAGGPAVPWAGTFLETNVRLYSVDATGRRGVVFLSLDADRAVAVAAARAGFGLPYRWSRMQFTAEGAERRYTTRVRWPGPRCVSDVAVRVGGPAPDGPLERFLTARWGLHVERFGRTWFLPNAHPPWPLRTADVLALTTASSPPPGWAALPGARRTMSCSATAWRRRSGRRCPWPGRSHRAGQARRRDTSRLRKGMTRSNVVVISAGGSELSASRRRRAA